MLFSSQKVKILQILIRILLNLNAWPLCRSYTTNLKPLNCVFHFRANFLRFVILVKNFKFFLILQQIGYDFILQNIGIKVFKFLRIHHIFKHLLNFCNISLVVSFNSWRQYHQIKVQWRLKRLLLPNLNQRMILELGVGERNLIRDLLWLRNVLGIIDVVTAQLLGTFGDSRLILGDF